ncbi:cytosolic non-specific dipeptidase-like [Haemaphysalis longicornis]
MDKSSLPTELAVVFKVIERNTDAMVSCLKDLVAIPTVSSDPAHRKDILRLVQLLEQRLKRHGLHVTVDALDDQRLPGGRKAPSPPVLVATTNPNAGRKTLCVYGHVDVQPAYKDDGWDTEPFKPVEKDGRLHGRGTSDNKGPLVAWIWALCSYLDTAGRPPLNLVFLIDSAEGVGSQNLEAYLSSANRSPYLNNVNYVCISCGVWLGPTKPCLTYALRGMCHFQVEVTCAKRDMHSGIYGGTTAEAMSDLMYLLNGLVDPEGRIKIPGIYDDVKPVSAEERKLYENIDFDLEAYRREMGVSRLPSSDKFDILSRRWRQPSLSIHGVEGAVWSTGEKAVIPGRVIGKFSIQTVPNQSCQKVKQCVDKYLQEQFSKRSSMNQVRVMMTECSDTWVTDPHGVQFRAADAAVKNVYGVSPDKTCSGGSVTSARLLQQYVCRDVMLMTINPAGCGLHSQNEHIRITDLVNGAKLFAAYMHELSKCA